uniref:Fibronectin type-III domain-containing protein n=1 Tax=viral metagenome TaxID=1070528 RepID=A0A6C0B2G8_9ZZZZ
MSFSFFNSFNGNSQRLGQNYSIVSPDVNPPGSVSSIGSDTSSVTFSFTAPRTGGTISGYTAYVNGKPFSGTGGPSSYTINGLSPGGNYTISMVANIVSTSSTSSTTATTFIPTSISSCALWLDAADATTITQSSSLVSSWADKSGQGFHFTQNASKPTYGTTTDSKPSVNFNVSSSQYLSNTTISTTTSYTILIVNKFIEYGGRNDSNRIFTSTFNPGLLMQVSYPPSKYYVGGMGNGSGGWSGLITAGDMISLNIIAQTHDGTNLYAYQNGTTYGPVSAISSATYTGLAIGGPVGGQFYNGNICEILMYNSVLSTTNRQKIEGYLAWKWGLQTSLPGAHPYYSSAPTGGTTTVTTTTTKNVLSNPSRPLVISTLAPFPTNITLISATTTSLTFSFTAPTTGSTPTGYTPYINGSAGTGSGTPSSYTISGLSAGTNYSVALGANVSTAGALNPTTISGCLVWLDGADTTSIVFSGSNITQWNDKSNSGYNFTQATTASQPTYSAMSNGKNGINLGTSKYMTNTSVAFPTNYTIFAIGYTASNGYGRLLQGSITNGQTLYFGSGNGNKNFATVNGPGTASFSDASIDNSPATSVASLCLMEMTNNNTNTGLIPYVNGTALTAKNGITTTFTALVLGSSPGGGSQYWNGYVAEILIYNSVLTTTQRQQVEGYLMWKWGLQTSLPGAHPYYSAAPTGSVTTIYQNPSPVSLTTAIGSPTTLTFISSTATTITFSFTAPSGTVTGYTPYVNGSVGVGSGTASSYTITGLTSGTSYSITVSAYGPAVTSAQSTSVSMTTYTPPDPYQTESNITIAYGMFLIVPTYTGPVVSIRNSGTGVTADFYADKTQSYLTTGAGGTGTSYSSWISTNTGYLTKWYDQGSVGNHGTQTNTAIQPNIILISGKYIPQFSSTVGSYIAFTTSISPYTIFSQLNILNETSGYNGVLGNSSTWARLAIMGGGLGGQGHQYDWLPNSGTVTIYVNGATATGITNANNYWNTFSLSASNPMNANFNRLGTDGYNTSRGMNGYMACMVCNNKVMTTSSMAKFYDNRLIL